MEPFPPTAPTPLGPTADPWTSPGAVADAPRFRSLPTIFDEPRSSDRALRASPVSRLQPRTVGQLLDGGFEVLRFRFRTVSIVAATIVLPLYALPQALLATSGAFGSASLDSSSNPFLTPSGDVSDGFWTTIGLAYLTRFGLMLATMLLGVAVTHLVMGWLVGADPTPGETLRFVRGRLPTTILAFGLASLLKLAAALPCFLGLLYVLPALSVLAPVIAAEGVGATEAIVRSLRLTRRCFWPAFGVAILWFLTSSVLSTAAGGAAAVVGGLVTGSTRGVEIGVQAIDVVGTVVLTVVQVAVTALLYVDLRVRTEGLDLELEATDRFHDATR